VARRRLTGPVPDLPIGLQRILKFRLRLVIRCPLKIHAADPPSRVRMLLVLQHLFVEAEHVVIEGPLNEATGYVIGDLLGPIVVLGV